MPRFLTALLFSALLLSPRTVSAQTFAKVPSHYITVQIALVPVAVADLDALGINFNYLPLSKPHTFLAFASGHIVQELYQTLTRVHSRDLLIISASIPDKKLYALPVNIKVPDYRYHVTGTPDTQGAPRLLGYFQLQGKLILTPYILPDNTVMFDIASDDSKNVPLHFKAIPDGQSLVIIAPNVQIPDVPILSSIHRLPDSLPKTDELLIFITPTITENSKTPPSTQ